MHNYKVLGDGMFLSVKSTAMNIRFQVQKWTVFVECISCSDISPFPNDLSEYNIKGRSLILYRVGIV